MLPPELTIEDLYEEHPSRPRNPRIAAVLFRANMMENWGTGTVRIVESCRSAGLPRPEFSSEMGVFKVRFRKARAMRRTLDDRRALVTAYVQEHGSISTKEYAEANAVSERSALRTLSELEDSGVLVQMGSGPTTRYLLPDNPLIGLKRLPPER